MTSDPLVSPVLLRLRDDIAATVAAHPIYGAIQTAAALHGDLTDRMLGTLSRPNTRYNLLLRWSQGWGLDASLCVEISRHDGEAAVVLEGVSEVSWSSSGRHIGQATAALALYRQVTELGALLQTVCSIKLWRNGSV